jgi:hypothetical protein
MRVRHGGKLTPMGRLVALALFLQLPVFAGTAADLARAIRESSFDRGECYRVRDLTLQREDIRIYLSDGHLIFGKPIAGHRIAAVFTADTDGGDGEVIVFPPDRAERRSLAAFTRSPNLDDHFRNALFIFTGAEYDELQSQIAKDSSNKKTPELGALMDERWTPVLHNLAASYETRLVLDLMNGSAHTPDLLSALFDSPKLGAFDVVFDARSPEQILGGKLVDRDNRSYFDDWFSFAARSFRKNPAPQVQDLVTSDYRIEATIDSDLSMSVATRVKVRTPESGIAAANFEITPAMNITSVTVDGRPAEALQPDALRADVLRAGNKMFLVVPSEPLQPNRDYEFEFHHSGKVVIDAGDRVLYVAARGNWYPGHSLQFASYDLTFRYPRDLDLVAPGNLVDERTEGAWRIAHRQVSTPIRTAGFNLGDYAHAVVERGGYTVDICANRKLELALQSRATDPMPLVNAVPQRRAAAPTVARNSGVNIAIDPLARLHTLADEVASALEFMAAKLGPPALPHLTVSPIPGTFGQGFPGLIYLSTLAYLKDRPLGNSTSPSLDLYFDDVLQAHETAHQWWGNRVTTANYRDSWLMEALANYTALLYLEKRRGPHAVDQMLESYRGALLQKNAEGEMVDSAGPIVLGMRLQNSQQPAGWRAITYGKGSWILHMLRRRMGDQQFLAMLGDLMKHFDHSTISTEQFRKVAAQFLPPKSDDPALESFFDQWVYGTGIPGLKLTYSLKGQAPAVRLMGTLTQSGVDGDFSALTPIEIQLARGQSMTRWVASSSEPVTFTVALKQTPLKVTLDPHNAVLRR